VLHPAAASPRDCHPTARWGPGPGGLVGREEGGRAGEERPGRAAVSIPVVAVILLGDKMCLGPGVSWEARDKAVLEY